MNWTKLETWNITTHNGGPGQAEFSPAIAAALERVFADHTHQMVMPITGSADGSDHASAWATVNIWPAPTKIFIWETLAWQPLCGEALAWRPLRGEALTWRPLCCDSLAWRPLRGDALTWRPLWGEALAWRPLRGNALTWSGPGLAGITWTGLASTVGLQSSSSSKPAVNNEPTSNRVWSIYSIKVQLIELLGIKEETGSFWPAWKMKNVNQLTWSQSPQNSST